MYLVRAGLAVELPGRRSCPAAPMVESALSPAVPVSRSPSDIWKGSITRSPRRRPTHRCRARNRSRIWVGQYGRATGKLVEPGRRPQGPRSRRDQGAREAVHRPDSFEGGSDGGRTEAGSKRRSVFYRRKHSVPATYEAPNDKHLISEPTLRLSEPPNWMSGSKRIAIGALLLLVGFVLVIAGSIVDSIPALGVGSLFFLGIASVLWGAYASMVSWWRSRTPGSPPVALLGPYTSPPAYPYLPPPPPVTTARQQPQSPRAIPDARHRPTR